MRTLAKFSVDTPAGNAAIRSGELPKIIASTLESLKPEAAYFITEDGQRTALIVFDLKDLSDLPVIADPWFELNAGVSFVPAMTADDVRAGMQKLARSK